MTHEQRIAAETALTLTVRRRGQLERTITEQVATMRAAGATWEDVAHALGVTRQAAHKRYGWGGGGHRTTPTTDQCTCRVGAPGTRREYRVLNRECPVHGDAAETRRNGDRPATLQPVPKVDKPPPPPRRRRA